MRLFISRPSIDVPGYVAAPLRSQRSPSMETVVAAGIKESLRVRKGGVVESK